MECIRGTFRSITRIRFALPLAALLLLLVPSAGLHAQFERDLMDVGIWGGMNVTSMADMNPAGLGYGATATYHLLPYISARASVGVLMHAFNRADYKLLPPSNGNTFHSRVIPLEMTVRLRSADQVDEGGVMVSLGAAVTWYERDELQAQHNQDGPQTLPGVSGLTFGPVVGAGLESSRFIGGKGRLFTDIVIAPGLTKMSDTGKKLLFVAFRFGTTYAI